MKSYLKQAIQNVRHLSQAYVATYKKEWQRLKIFVTYNLKEVNKRRTSQNSMTTKIKVILVALSTDGIGSYPPTASPSTTNNHQDRTQRYFSKTRWKQTSNIRSTYSRVSPLLYTKSHFVALNSILQAPSFALANTTYST